MKTLFLTALLWANCSLVGFPEPYKIHFKLLAFTEKGANELGIVWAEPGSDRHLRGARIASSGVTPSFTPPIRFFTPFAKAGTLDYIEGSGQSVTLVDSIRTTEVGAPTNFDGMDYFESRGENGEFYPWPVGSKVNLEILSKEVVGGRNRLNLRLRFQSFGVQAKSEILPEEPLVDREDFWIKDDDVFMLRGCLRVSDSLREMSADAGPLVQEYFKAVPKGGGFCGLVISIGGG